MEDRKIKRIIIAIIIALVIVVIASIVLGIFLGNNEYEESRYDVENIINESTNSSLSNQITFEDMSDEASKIGTYEYEGSYKLENSKYSFDIKGVLPLSFKLTITQFEDGTVEVVPWYEDYQDLGKYTGTYNSSTSDFKINLTKHILPNNKETEVNENFEFTIIENSNNLKVKTEIMNVPVDAEMIFSPEE